MNRFIFWQRWLFALSLTIIVFGLAIALTGKTALIEPLNRQVDPIFWGEQTVPQPAVAFQGWIYGVLGATMAGWGVFIAFLAHYPFRRKEQWAWNCLALGIMVWYLPDTTISLYSGVTLNAIVNTVLLVLVALPLIFTRRDFAPDAEK